MASTARSGRVGPSGTSPVPLSGRQQSELTRESSFMEDRRDGDGSDRSDSGSYVSGSEYTDGSYTDGSYTDGDEQTQSETDYEDEDYGSSPNSDHRRGFLPDVNSAGRQRVHKYHTYPEMQVASHRTITVFRNGDMNFPGQLFVVGPQIKSWNYLLDCLTTRVKPPWGAVRRLYNLDTGRRVQNLDDVEDGESYVVARMEQLKRVNYHAIEDVETKRRLYTKPNIDKMKYKPKKVGGRNVVEKPLTIFVLANGDRDGVVTKVILKSRDRISFGHILDLITERLGFTKMQSVAKKLIDLETKDSVTRMGQIKHGRFYVAIDKPSNIRMPPFRVNSARQIVPVIGKKKRFKDMPVMFDGPIRGKVDAREKLVEQREARGIVSDVGKVVRVQKKRVQIDPQPVKQPFPRMLTVAEPPESSQYQRVKLGNTPQDRMIWRIVHECVDDLSTSLIEQVLQEQQQALYQLLNNIVIMRTTVKQDPMVLMQERSPEPPEPARPRRSSIARRLDINEGNFAYEFDQYIDDFLGYINEPDSDIFSEKVVLNEEQEILKDRFTQAMIAAVEGRLPHWEDDPRSLVALIVLLDQIPRRVYGGTIDQFSGDKLASGAISRAINESELIQQVAPEHMLYVCIALSHQESMQEQRVCQKIMQDLGRTFPKEDADQVAQQLDKNRKIIERFGRFPQRNDVLGRSSTDEEESWLTEQRENALQQRRSGEHEKIGRTGKRRWLSRSILRRSNKSPQP